MNETRPVILSEAKNLGRGGARIRNGDTSGEGWDAPPQTLRQAQGERI